MVLYGVSTLCIAICLKRHCYSAPALYQAHVRNRYVQARDASCLGAFVPCLSRPWWRMKVENWFPFPAGEGAVIGCQGACWEALMLSRCTRTSCMCAGGANMLIYRYGALYYLHTY
ncbi:hypothetical protein V8C37DRAFT_379934 [Trichoderma ceciliae]